MKNNLHNKQKSSLQEVLLHKRRLVANQNQRFTAVKVSKIDQDDENQNMGNGENSIILGNLLLIGVILKQKIANDILEYK